ncbi:type III effector HrpK [Paramesorhizobium deserti]|uniref:Type III effector HrpK n=1 Tax=Paramesorhizobium deserti TaxID=1494590 RepID=A0A135HNJ9_9HYPH|nr:type III effector HrpK domain-containing protein [Paramesorhizobium deserti]KXF74788.1 type III effector HrpK [Paramesorhizobium deserti]
MSKISATQPNSTGGPVDISASQANWEFIVAKAKQQDGNNVNPDAERLGIVWELPKGDNRSAQDIIDDTPLLRDLGNQSGVKDMLRNRVGDFEHDADAAFKAKQVLEHIETFDEEGNRIAGKDVGNGRIDGFTSSGEARHGTEAGRLQDFGKYGLSNLKGELQNPASVGDDQEAREQAEALGIEWTRPEGDDRSARDIIDDTPLLRDLGNQSGVKDMLKDRVGDFEHDADAAYRAKQVLEHIETFDEEGNKIAGKDVDNGRIDGFTNSGEARHGTEAGRLQDFGKYGFSNLKGKRTDWGSVGKDQEAREQAEALGIEWTRPKGDDRSAQDIIDDTPLLRDLGNQSGVRDMLKDRVGDFEHDADAAYRAKQVLERIEGYNEEGKILTGDDVGNGRIDGFTKSGEAKHGTEAGRLQDFGKYGFSSLDGESGKYRDFVKNNPDADETSKKIFKYASILEQNYDAIKDATDSGDHLTADALKKYREDNPDISDEFKEALDFWSNPGAFSILETAQDNLKFAPDGKLSDKDISGWLTNQAPKDAGSAVALLSSIADRSIVSGVDTKNLDKDVFEHPENYSPEQKAAVLQELLQARQLVIQGAGAGMWKDDYGKVAIANDAGVYWEPEKLLEDINNHIEILQNDPETVKYMSENGAGALEKLVGDNEGLKEALTKTYEDEIKSGKALDDLWKTRSEGENGADQQAILAEFFGNAQVFQSALGIEDISELQRAVQNSSHNGEFEEFYENSLVSGDRLKELLKDHSFEEATSAFSMEVALYNAALNPEFTGQFDTQLNDNFTDIVQENAFKDASFEDLKEVFGVNGGDELDEEKVKKLIEQISKDSPELLLNQDGTLATPDSILATFRGDWDLLRQGTKTFDQLGLLDKDSSARGAANAGVLHGVSGLFLVGVTIAKGAGGAGNLTDRQIVDITTGSVMTATILTEGGIKGYRDYLNGLKDKVSDDLLNNIGSLLDDVSPESQVAQDKNKFYEKLGSNLRKFEEAAKGLGGIAGIAAGAYAIFDGVKAIRNGDKVGGGFSIAAGAAGAMAGLASAVEGGLGVLGATVPRLIPILAGGLGMLAAGVGAVALLIPGLIAEGKHQSKVDSFGPLLGSYLEKYEIDGVENGDLSDIPDEDWPGGDQTGLS